MVFREYSYGLPSVYLCCTVGARGLHLWCQGAALLLALLFLHFHCCMALCKPAATELKIKKRSRIARIFFGVFYTDSFFDFFFLI